MKTNNKINPKVCRILLDGRELEYLLTRSSRKTIGIAIEKSGVVKVTSPLRVSESYINELLKQKTQWILKKLSDVETRAAEAKKTKTFINDEAFSYLGKEYKLKIVISGGTRKPNVRIKDEYLEIAFPKSIETEKLKNILKLWYVEQFKLVIEARVKHYSTILGVFPQRITIREQKTRWGSCSSKGNINLNWKLIMAAPEILDYVVVHELCHMRQLNHSREFWKLVELVFPNYKKCRVWLKENGDLLCIE